MPPSRSLVTLHARALHAAVAKGDVAATRAALVSRLPGAPEPAYEELLTVAARADAAEVVSTLLAYAASDDGSPRKGVQKRLRQAVQAALEAACEAGATAAAQELLDHGATCDDNAMTLAARNGHLHLLRELAEREQSSSMGPDGTAPATPPRDVSRTPLHDAAANGDADAVTALLADAADADGRAALLIVRLVKRWTETVLAPPSGKCLMACPTLADVVACTYSADGGLMAAACADTTVRMWEADTGVAGPLLRCAGGTPSPGALAFAHAHRTLVVGSSGGMLTLWDAPSTSRLAAFTAHAPAACTAVAFSPVDDDVLLSAGGDSVLCLWRLQYGVVGLAPRRERTLRGHVGVVLSCAWNAKATRIASAGNDAVARLWDPSSGTCTATLRGHSAAVRGVAFSPDGTLLASTSEDATLRLWDARPGGGGACIAVMRGHSAALRCAPVFSPDGATIATGADDSLVQLWGPAPPPPPPLDDGELYDGATASDGAASAGGGAWRVLATLRGHSDAVLCVAFSCDGARLLSGGTDADGHSLRLWDARREMVTMERSAPVTRTVMAPSPLHLAAEGAHVAAAEALLHGGARVDIRDADECTPLMCAAAAASAAPAPALALCRMLLRAGADANARDAAGCSPADAAGSAPVRALLACGGLPAEQAVLARFKPPLSDAHAAWARNSEALPLAVQHIADADAALKAGGKAARAQHAAAVDAALKALRSAANEAIAEIEEAEASWLEAEAALARAVAAVVAKHEAARAAAARAEAERVAAVVEVERQAAARAEVERRAAEAEAARQAAARAEAERQAAARAEAERLEAEAEVERAAAHAAAERAAAVFEAAEAAAADSRAKAEAAAAKAAAERAVAQRAAEEQAAAELEEKRRVEEERMALAEERARAAAAAERAEAERLAELHAAAAKDAEERAAAEAEKAAAHAAAERTNAELAAAEAAAAEAHFAQAAAAEQVALAKMAAQLAAAEQAAAELDAEASANRRRLRLRLPQLPRLAPPKLPPQMPRLRSMRRQRTTCSSSWPLH